MHPSSTPSPRVRTLAVRALSLASVAWLALLLGPSPAAARSTPTLLTNASPSTLVGLQVFDHTNLGGVSPTGTITFRLYGPGDTSCSSPVFTTTTTVSGTGSDDSSAYATRSAGTYNWIAAYSGDANNNPVSTPCGSPSQAVVVSKSMPVASVAAATAGGGAIHATATISGGFAPATGPLTFIVTGPNDQFCGGAPVYTQTVAVNGAGTYDSGSYTPTAAGTYTFRIRYDGDTNNYGVGPTACLDSGASVTVSASQLRSPPVKPPLTKPPAAAGPAGTAPSGTGPAAVGPPTPGHPSPAAAGLVFGGPAHCVRGPFKVFVGGGQIGWVAYYLHGRRLHKVSRARSSGRFVATVNPRGLPRRTVQRLTARVAGPGGLRVLHRVFSVCA